MKTESVPECAKGLNGNINYSNPLYNWSFTYNNYNLIEVENKLVPVLKMMCKYGTIQEETGDSGTPHLQGQLNFKTKIRFTALKKIDAKISWSPTRNDIAAINYTIKEETRTGKSWIWFHDKKTKEMKEIKPKYKTPISELYDWQKTVRAILETEPDNRTIYWVYEPDGCKGKTTFQKHIYGEMDNVICLSGKGADMKNGIVEYEKSTGMIPRIIFINVPRSNKGFISYTGIEEVKDMFFYSGKYEGGMVCAKNPHVVIFSNDLPEYDKMSMDRWKLIDITKGTVINEDIEETL